MKHTPIAVLALSLIAAAAAAPQEAQSGPPRGQRVAEFQFVDLTGPNRGRQLSQVEAFGAGPVVMALVNESPYQARELIAGIQKLADTYKAEKLKAFVAFVAGPDVQEPILRVTREKDVSIPIGYVTNRRELTTYGIDAAARNTVVLYRSRRVHTVLTDVGGEGLPDVAKAAKQMLAERDGQTGSR